MVRDVVLVFLGGGLGSVLRWLTGAAMLRLMGPSFPWGTFTVNLIGCFIMGLAFRLLPLIEGGVHPARLLVMTGILGGFTTFSAFALDAAGLWMRQETGASLAYVGATFLASLGGVALGLIIGKWIMG